MKKLLNIFLAFNVAFTFTLLSLTPAHAAAGTLTALSDTLSRTKKSTLSSHTMKFTTSVAIQVSGDTIVITFPSDFSFATKAIATVSLTHGASTGAESTETLAASPSATAWGAVFSGTSNRIFTLTTPTDGIGSAALAANDKVIITYDSTNSTNATTQGSYAVTVAVAGTNTATAQFADYIIDDDQVGVTGTVDPSLSFSISDIAIGFGSFIGTAIRYATGDAAGNASVPANDLPTKLVVSTNGDNGATITIQDEGSGSNPGLWSASPISELIPAAASTLVTTGSKKYGAYGKNASSLTIHESFDNDTNSDVAISRTAQTFASATDPLSSASVDLTLLAAIDATTKAGAYTDTITIICTGNF